jgi:hypothetical protein
LPWGPTIKRNQSHGVDGLLNEHFIEFKDFLMPTLLRVFNGILQSGIFSTAWEVAVLVPIFKRGNPEDPNNFRGISNKQVESCFLNHNSSNHFCCTDSLLMTHRGRLSLRIIILRIGGGHVSFCPGAQQFSWRP